MSVPVTAPLCVAELVDGHTLCGRLTDAGLDVLAAAPIYVRHKPNQSSVVALRIECTDAGSPERVVTYGYAHWCAEPERAAELYAKALTKRPRESAFGPGVLHLDPHTVVFAFPNDARLGRLRWYVDPRKVRRSLHGLTADGAPAALERTAVDVLRYKPLRRVVCAVSIASTHGPERTMFVRYATRRGAAALAEAARHLRVHGVLTPRSIATLDDDHVSVDEFVAGDQLLEAVQGGRSDPTEFAAALQRFHRVPLLAEWPERRPIDELARVRSGLVNVAAWHRHLEPIASRVGALLAATIPVCGEPVLLHGDLHANNVLLSEDGIVFVDLERRARGPAAIDLGYLLAHALAAPIRGRADDSLAAHARLALDSYQRRAGKVEAASLSWHTAIGLVDQALLVIRHIEPDWIHTAQRLLALAADHCAAATSDPEPLLLRSVR